MESVVAFFLDLIHKAGYPGLFLVMMLGNMGIPTATEIIGLGGRRARRYRPLAQRFPGRPGLDRCRGRGLRHSLCDRLFRRAAFRGALREIRRPEFAQTRCRSRILREVRDADGVPRTLPAVHPRHRVPPGGHLADAKRYFFTYTALGSAIFCFGLAYLGAAFGSHLDQVMPVIHRFSLVFLGVILVAAAGGFLAWNSRRKPRRWG